MNDKDESKLAEMIDYAFPTTRKQDDHDSELEANKSPPPQIITTSDVDSAPEEFGVSGNNNDRHVVTCERNHILKKTLLENGDKFICTICARVITALDAAYIYGCDSEMCNCLICEECFSNRKSKTLFCPKQHPLDKTTRLNWKCKGCEQVKKNDVSFRCHECSYDICEKCHTDLTKTWQLRSYTSMLQEDKEQMYHMVKRRLSSQSVIPVEKNTLDHYRQLFWHGFQKLFNFVYIWASSFLIALSFIHSSSKTTLLILLVIIFCKWFFSLLLIYKVRKVAKKEGIAETVLFYKTCRAVGMKKVVIGLLFGDETSTSKKCKKILKIAAGIVIFCDLMVAIEMLVVYVMLGPNNEFYSTHLYDSNYWVITMDDHDTSWANYNDTFYTFNGTSTTMANDPNLERVKISWHDTSQLRNLDAVFKTWIFYYFVYLFCGVVVLVFFLFAPGYDSSTRSDNSLHKREHAPGISTSWTMREDWENSRTSVRRSAVEMTPRHNNAQDKAADNENETTTAICDCCDKQLSNIINGYFLKPQKKLENDKLEIYNKGVFVSFDHIGFLPHRAFLLQFAVLFAIATFCAIEVFNRLYPFDYPWFVVLMIVPFDVIVFLFTLFLIMLALRCNNIILKVAHNIRHFIFKYEFKTYDDCQQYWRDRTDYFENVVPIQIYYGQLIASFCIVVSFILSCILVETLLISSNNYDGIRDALSQSSLVLELILLVGFGIIGIHGFELLTQAYQAKLLHVIALKAKIIDLERELRAKQTNNIKSNNNTNKMRTMSTNTYDTGFNSMRFRKSGASIQSITGVDVEPARFNDAGHGRSFGGGSLSANEYDTVDDSTHVQRENEIKMMIESISEFIDIMPYMDKPFAIDLFVVKIEVTPNFVKGFSAFFITVLITVISWFDQ